MSHVCKARLLLLDAPPLDEKADLPEERILERCGIWPIVTTAEQLSDQAFMAALSACHVLLSWSKPVPAELLKRARNCLLVQIYGPGTGPARIDLEAARQLGIYVASLPNY